MAVIEISSTATVTRAGASLSPELSHEIYGPIESRTITTFYFTKALPFFFFPTHNTHKPHNKHTTHTQNIHTHTHPHTHTHTSIHTHTNTQEGTYTNTGREE